LHRLGFRHCAKTVAKVIKNAALRAFLTVGISGGDPQAVKERFGTGRFKRTNSFGQRFITQSALRGAIFKRF